MIHDLAYWRERLQNGQAELHAAFDTVADTARLLKQHVRLVDELLRDLWRQAELPPSLALCAVGGYGRGELFPHSDVDLLILLPDDHDAAFDRQLEPLIRAFWDIGLAVGHSVRSLQECMDEAAQDITVLTSLLEARPITGSRALLKTMQSQLRRNFDAATFVRDKIAEQNARHAKFNDTAYNLEPNLKEGPGGLRDLQNILWISHATGLGNSWNALAENGLITRGEARQIRRQELFMQMLRARLHYLAKRREDRLLFDFQNELAAQLGYVATSKKRASEQMMQHFYRSAKFIRLMNEILLQALQEQVLPHHPATPVNARFQMRDGLLEARAPNLLQQHPDAIFEAFLLLEQHPELNGFSAEILRDLWRMKSRINHAFRMDANNRRLFMQIMRQPRGVTATLRRMNRYGILGRYIPAFGRIEGQMQHDLFHVYTVDEHILNVLRNLRRFAVPQFAHEFPFCSQLIAGFDKPELLYLAALFHDIAKGRDGDHSTLGMADARRFCKLHDLPKEDAALVAWLVGHHLTLSLTAQKSDLSDPAVIENFARIVKTEHRLTALYLLTVADIRGTSPAIWNGWKARLLENLFQLAQKWLRGHPVSAAAEFAERQKQAAELLAQDAIKPETYRPLWSKFGRGYFLRHEAHEIAWHTRSLLFNTHPEKPVVRARLGSAGDGIQVMIYIHDRENLFACICSFFERAGFNIVEARIHTTRHDYALDSFLVLDEENNALHYKELLNDIERDLTKKLESAKVPPPPMNGRISRQLKHFPMKPSVTLEPEKNNNHQLSIIAGDRPGLLSRIAQTLMRHDAQLHTAKINTLGNRAEDTFLISGAKGEKLSAEAVAALKEELLKEL
ncbi:MAG: [protein-PII] uridylyltransferase [Methylobacillus sp.]|nr:[protein-PII] uridylyltransferase [Methylobacillus sp.]